MIIAINYLIHLCAQLPQLRHGYIARIVSVDRLCYQWETRAIFWQMTNMEYLQWVLQFYKMLVIEY